MAGGAIIGALKVVLGIDSASLDKGLKDTRLKLDNFGKGTSGVAKEIFNLRNAMIGIASGAIVALIKRSVDYADSLGETADMIGINTDALQELRYAFGLNGVSAEEFDKAMLQLTKRLGEAQLGTNEASKALGQLGISLEMVKGKSPDQVLRMISDGLASVTDKTKQAQIQTDLFGKTGQKLLPTLVQGASYLDRMAFEAHQLGLVLSKETLKKASDANDEFDRMGSALRVAGVNASVQFLPVLTELRKLFTSPEFQNGVKDAAANLGKLISYMVENKDTILQVLAGFGGARIGAAFGPVGTIIGGVTGAVVSGIKLQSGAVKELEGQIRAATSQIALLQDYLTREKDPKNIMAYAGQIENLQKQIEEAKNKIAELQAQTANKPLITVTPKDQPEFFSPEVKKAIDDAIFKTRILTGEFNNLAEGFPEAVRGMNLFGSAATDTIPAMEKLPKQVQDLNDALLKSQAAKILDGIKTSTEKYDEELAKLNVLHAAGKLSAEEYSRAVAAIQFPDLTKAINDASNLQKQLDSFSTNSVNSTADALTDIVTGAKSAKEAFADLAKAVIRDLVQMTIKAILFKGIIAPLFGFSEGGSFLMGSGGGGLSFASGGSFTVPGGSSMSDNQMLPINVASGERVTVDRPNGPGGAGLKQINYQVSGRRKWWNTEDLVEMIRDFNRLAPDGYVIKTA